MKVSLHEKCLEIKIKCSSIVGQQPASCPGGFFLERSRQNEILLSLLLYLIMMQIAVCDNENGI
jgi:hypothetical protein